jgi:hypothetical protein
MDVGTTAVPIAASGLIQNLGPDPVYIGEGSVTLDSGVRLGVGESMTVGHSNGTLYIMSESSSDVRVLGRATGIFVGEIPA